ncbi:DNA gyrase C-terminal beta-propeller domain-containing protein, partial [uncultured Actinomyces sp.]|uniref:DNA gyrase C-terminal beta-propeller domain-containing protein n=1 Tax=uncultured Actinomyces sp. TaxID=249061 RepID=UPI00288A92D7
DVVVTITRSGYAKRTRTDAYRSQHRGGKGVKGAALREDDVVDHFFVTTTHRWLLFFTNLGRVYRAKAYELPEGGRDAKGQHVANLLAFQQDEEIAQVMELGDYDQADYLVLATRRGLVKKTRLAEYDSNRSGGVIAINLRANGDGVNDELVSASLLSAGQDLLLVSRGGQSLRFRADDETLRPTGRATSGVTGMRFREGDSLLAMDVVDPQWGDADLFVVTEGGYAKRTAVADYPTKGRGGLGVKVASLVEERGSLVGALVTAPGDEVLCIMASGKVVRSAVAEVSRTGRATQGVTFAKPDDGDRIIAVARSAERELDDDRTAGSGPEGGPGRKSEEGIVSAPSPGPARGGDDAVSSGHGTDSEEQA